MAHEFIYTCYKLARFYPPDRTILENISLSFYPGAKIGVIGSNGSGKSSLLRIMAGLDDGFTGEARLTPGFTVGLLEQEPQLDPSKDVLGNVMDGVGPIRDMLARYDEVMANVDEHAVNAEAKQWLDEAEGVVEPLSITKQMRSVSGKMLRATLESRSSACCELSPWPPAAQMSSSAWVCASASSRRSILRPCKPCAATLPFWCLPIRKQAICCV